MLWTQVTRKGRSSQEKTERGEEEEGLLPDGQGDESGHSALNIWMEEHKYMIYGAVATGAAAVAALFWAVRRR